MGLGNQTYTVVFTSYLGLLYIIVVCLYELVNMSDNFELLKSDDDVLLFEKDTFTVERFKELCAEQLRRKIYLNQNKSMVIFEHLDRGLYLENKVFINLNSSKWESMSEEIECKLLKIGDSGWRKGRLRVKNYVDFLPEEYKGYRYNHNAFQYPKANIEIELEFCPDLTIEPESLLDDIRQSESYQKLL
ncbi:MAG: KGK domain-containing protein [Trichodesmium sp.]